ncbi:MAG: cell division protein ZapA [Elusimicrobia bacterium]|nr:cell division protein ZapA [Elusimicrobiota bacterium]
MENDAEIKIKGRQLKISIDGLTPLEIDSIVGHVEEKMKEIEEQTQVVDTSKLALLCAIHFASELYNQKRKIEHLREANDKKVDEMVLKLKTALDKELF